MLKYIVKRLLITIPTILGITIIIFAIVHLIPGDPIQIMFGRSPDKEQIENLTKLYGLDRPLVAQYFVWIKNVVSGDLGESIQRGTPIAPMLMTRFLRTLYLCVFGVIVSVILSFPTGIIAAYKHNKWQDLTVSTSCLILISIPSFWLGILLILLFSVSLNVFPAVGYISPFVDFGRSLSHIFLPMLALGGALAAVSARILRVSLLEVLNQDYITLARVKGGKEKRVLFIHALRNALIPTITIVGMQMGYILGGAIIIEKVFAYPGMGLLLVSSISERDYPVIQATCLLFALTFILINLFTDLIYALIDPKIRYK